MTILPIIMSVRKALSFTLLPIQKNTRNRKHDLAKMHGTPQSQFVWVGQTSSYIKPANRILERRGGREGPQSEKDGQKQKFHTGFSGMEGPHKPLAHQPQGGSPKPRRSISVLEAALGISISAAKGRGRGSINFGYHFFTFLIFLK